MDAKSIARQRLQLFFWRQRIRSKLKQKKETKKSLGVLWIASLALVDAISGIAERSLKIRLIGSLSNDEGDGNENDKKQKLRQSDHRQNLPLEHRELKQCMHCSLS